MLMFTIFIALMCLRRRERKAMMQDGFSNATVERMKIANSSRITQYRNVGMPGEKDPVELPVVEPAHEMPENMSRRSWRRSLTSIFSFTHSSRSRPSSEISPVPLLPLPGHHPLAHRLPPLETGEFSRSLLQRHWRLSITSTRSFRAASKANSKRSRRERPPSPPDTIKE